MTDKNFDLSLEYRCCQMYALKKAFIPLLGQKLTTSAVPPKLMYKTSTHFAYHHMHPTNNGQGSRKRLLSYILIAYI